MRGGGAVEVADIDKQVHALAGPISWEMGQADWAREMVAVSARCPAPRGV